MSRLGDLRKLYKLIDRLEINTCGSRKLEDCDPSTDRSDGGVYFFFEKGEMREKSGKGNRVVRVGICDSYRKRISGDHKGNPDRPLKGSNFRKWVANALFIKYRHTEFSEWPDITEMNFKDMPAALNFEQRHHLDCMIREHMYPMCLLFVPIGCKSCQKYIERNAVGLLSECRESSPIDPKSKRWLGKHSRSGKIRESGLWNSHFVTGGYEHGFLDRLKRYVD